jgi:2-polyprenyl-3-methyl-5-hydroxy-6-metoxy-1,4-benzoquinol methylase
MEYLSNCPICLSESFHNFLQTSDHFLTKESFHVVECDSCGFRFTNPRPSSEELSSFYESKEYISHSNEKRGILNKVYQSVRKYTIAGKFKIINQHKKPGNILDIGCGTGEFLHYMQSKSWNVTGIEPGENARRYAIRNYKLNVQPESYLSSLPPASFDVITLWHVLEHVPLLRERMKDVHSLLKNDGLLIVAVPDCSSWDAGYYGEFWAAWDLPRHLYHFTKSTMLKLAEVSSFNLIKNLPMKFDAYYVSLLSEKYKNGNASYLKAIRNGYRSNRNARNKEGDFSSLIFLFKK